MYSRTRYEREREYTVPPRYDGSTFRMYSQGDRLTTGADEVKAAWRKHEEAELPHDTGSVAGTASENPGETAAKSPFVVDEPPFTPDDISGSDDASDQPDGKAAVSSREGDDSYVIGPPQRRSPLDALNGLLGRFSYEDALIGALILILAGENDSGNEDSSAAILALIILLALK